MLKEIYLSWKCDKQLTPVCVGGLRDSLRILVIIFNFWSKQKEKKRINKTENEAKEARGAVLSISLIIFVSFCLYSDINEDTKLIKWRNETIFKLWRLFVATFSCFVPLFLFFDEEEEKN